MGSSSVSTHRGCVHWQELLLAVSLLNFWMQPTTGQVTVESTEALEGLDATLRISHNARNIEQILWYRGENFDSKDHIAYLIVYSGNYLSGPPGGQVIINSDGSLVLKNVTIKDSGAYTIVIYEEDFNQMIACGWVDVYPRVSGPNLTASNTIVPEGNKPAVVFTCDTDADVIEWFFNGKRLQHSPRKHLSFDRRTLSIDPVLRQDAGEYHCKGSNPRSSRKSAGLNLQVTFE